ncbi:hypothetical protein Ctha_0248 [Chloroherpeton thalassium ATCC 35110]|uniref:DUF4383 domain-containing protein n=1 Tax=Chloroherpeton thalassium (strain ATCC 35110 / GB-78) TaxID=517418 RepID=B3QTH3_CHLT3|nr:hypothetical protein [Chloroherpeton thalassium]ACF12719.1 hypothetical protein Ctha_0248 [Chloroherpeton thalassium ATCC 35110]
MHSDELNGRTPSSANKPQEPQPQDPALRSPKRAAIFFASLLIMTIGVSGIIEGAYLFFKSAILVRAKGLDSGLLRINSIFSFLAGLLMVLTAAGTIRISYMAWRAAFFTTTIFVLNSAWGSYIFYGNPLSFGSFIHLTASLAIFLLLWKASGVWNDTLLYEE